MTSLINYGKYYAMLGLALGLLIMSSCSSSPPTGSNNISAVSSSSPTITPSITTFSYEIVNVYPHDKESFTEGLVLDNGTLYEGTGLNGKSSIREVDLTTGDILRVYNLPSKYFGEGITISNNKLIQLTYTTNIGFVYDKSSFALLSDFSFSTEGWGLTFDGQNLIMSDGTSKLFFLNPVTFKITNQIDVKDRNIPVDKLNELEYINGKVYANVWLTNKIAVIDPGDGLIVSWIDLSGLLQTQGYNGQVDVLNGIAYNSQSGNLLVTGKYWPYLFEIKVK